MSSNKCQYNDVYDDDSGTAAQTAATEFAEALRARAIADQAVQLLEAHASSHATSLSWWPTPYCNAKARRRLLFCVVFAHM